MSNISVELDHVPVTELAHCLENNKRLLYASGIRKAFGGQVVLDDISLELHQGEVVLLRGDNGSGKTTLLNILTGNLEPDKGRIQLFTNGVEENFRFPKYGLQHLNLFDHFLPERVARKGIGRTWQDIRLFKTRTVLDNVVVAMPNQLGENPAWAFLRYPSVRKQERTLRDKASSLLAGLGLKDKDIYAADQISLGQSKRVAIARAIMAGARILFLDEPLAGLDASGINEILSLLEKLAHNERVTLVIVEHIFNIPHILKLADTVWTLNKKRISAVPASQIRQDETDRLANQHHTSWFVNSEKRMPVEELELPGHAILSKFPLNATRTNKVVLDVKDLIVRRGSQTVIGEMVNGSVRGLSFSLRVGEIGLLRAPNGWGKTTLIEALTGLLPVTSGEIVIGDLKINNMPPWRRVAMGITCLQSRNHTFPNLTVREMLQLSQVVHVPENVVGLLDKRAADLSGGEKQKVATACALKGRPFSIGLLDEPFAALDKDAINFLLQELSTLPDKAFLIVEPAFIPHLK